MPGQRGSSIDVEVLRSARCRGEASIPSENYLKLFNMTHEKVIAQEVWEKKLFNGNYEVMKLTVQE